ncbi:MAG: aspartyl protease family protein [Gemmataceae bacterium]
MRINGKWQLDEHGVLEPILFAKVLDASGSWQKIPFLIDTGAETTVFSPDDLGTLGLPCLPSRHHIVGVGGTVDVLTVDTKLQLELDSGSSIVINGPFDGLVEGREGEFSLLGRDVLSHFAAIFDRPGGVLALLHGRHRYSIHEDA